jgi:hypothetical protein
MKLIQQLFRSSCFAAIITETGIVRRDGRALVARGSDWLETGPLFVGRAVIADGRAVGAVIAAYGDGENLVGIFQIGVAHVASKIGEHGVRVLPSFELGADELGPIEMSDGAFLRIEPAPVGVRHIALEWSGA